MGSRQLRRAMFESTVDKQKPSLIEQMQLILTPDEQDL